MSAPIRSVNATVRAVADLSPTAREVRLALAEDLPFDPGAFVNVFADVNGETLRRAYTISSDGADPREIALTVRRVIGGRLSPIFWAPDAVGRAVRVMGPLGKNTASRMRGRKVRLFGFGVGVSAVKALAHRFALDPACEDLLVANGSRTEEEILYREFFEGIHAARPEAVRPPIFAVSSPESPGYPYPGFVQAHLGGVSFDGADVLICGPNVACEALAAAIREGNPRDLNLLIEGFG